MVKIIQKEHFTNIINKYNKLIFTICLSFTKNYYEAEDLTQETFISAYKSYDKFDGKNIKAWLTTIAANKCKDYLKKSSTKTYILPDNEFDHITSNDESPETIVINKDINTKIFSLCNKLKEPYRTVAINYFCKDIKLSDQAITTGKNLKTLQTNLYRAKKKLRVLYKEEFK